MEQFSSNNVEKIYCTAGSRRRVEQERVSSSPRPLRSEACTPSGAVGTWRSNVGLRRPRCPPCTVRGTVQLGVVFRPAESVTVFVAP